MIRYAHSKTSSATIRENRRKIRHSNALRCNDNDIEKHCNVWCEWTNVAPETLTTRTRITQRGFTVVSGRERRRRRHRRPTCLRSSRSFSCYRSNNLPFPLPRVSWSPSFFALVYNKITKRQKKNEFVRVWFFELLSLLLSL